MNIRTQPDQALKDRHFTSPFLHALDGIPCKAMIDVNIYDQSNSNINRREQLQSIPTLVFYDSTGRWQVFIDAMSPNKFRDTLT